MTKTGIIESVSVQGLSFFVVVRYDGVLQVDMMGNPVMCGRYLAGIPFYSPEKTASIAEVLIPLNVSAAVQCTDPKLLIGSRCVVHIDEEKDGFPIGVTLMSESDSRIISRQKMWEIRNINPDGVIDDRTRKEVEKDGSVKKESFKNICDETYDPEFHKGVVGVYNNVQDPIRTSVKDNSDTVDFSSRQSKENIAGIDGYRELRQKECYLPTTVFTGKT